MKHCALVFGIAASMFCATALPAQDAPKNMVGTWRIIKGREGGKDLPSEFTALARLVFSKDGKATLQMLEEGKDGKYQLPAAGQLNLSLGQADLSPGIYKFGGPDLLTICVATAPGGKRPSEFSGEKGTGQIRLDLQRVKPGEEKLTSKELAKNQEALAKIREAAARAQHINNLKQIGLGMHEYHDANNHFPAHAIYSKDGQTPLLSWRVALLPHLDEKALYQQFKLDEPWDSAHNKKLIAKMPKIYEVPGRGKPGEGLTHYQVFTGPDSLFDGPKKMRLIDITDGTSNTLLVIEGKNPVVWTKPEDLTLFKRKDRMPPLGGLFKAGIGVLFCDGSVHTFRLDPPIALLRAVITPNDGEVVDTEKLEP